MPGKSSKTDEQFFEESLSLFIDEGKRLQKIMPEVVDEYNDHSLLKLIAITYWVGIFVPIAHKQLKERFGYQVVYVDTMAGSGVTKTKRASDFFCGSFPGAINAANKRAFSFDKVIGVEIDRLKSEALDKRIKAITPAPIITIHSDDIRNVSKIIAKELESKAVSYIVIDPQGFQGMSWNVLEPLLKCKGDAMITWFEDDLWRVRGAALSAGKSAEGDAELLTELLGKPDWRDATSAGALTEIFIDRVLKATKKCAVRSIEIIDQKGSHYKMILFVGRCRNAVYLVDQWKSHMDRRLGSNRGLYISHLLDRKAGRAIDLTDFGLVE